MTTDNDLPDEALFYLDHGAYVQLRCETPRIQAMAHVERGSSADAALYAAQHAGRNCMVAAPEAGTGP
jgi:hypothetical protein